MTLVAHKEPVELRSQQRFDLSAKWVPAIALAADVVVMAAAFVLALCNRQQSKFFGRAATGLTVESTTLAPLILLAWVIAVAIRGGYAKEVFGSGTDEYKTVLSGGTLTAGVVGVGSYLTRVELSRGFFVILFLVGIPGMLLSRFAIRRALQAARRRGLLQRSALIVGGPHYVDDIASVLRRETWLGLSVVGALTPPGLRLETTPGGVPVLGDATRVAEVLSEQAADVVFFAAGAHTASLPLREMVWELEGQDVEIVMAPSLTDISSQRIRVRPVAGLPLIHVTPPTWSDASRWGKRAFDIVGALVCLTLASPILLASAIWIRAHDRGPILFRQDRVGRHGEGFSCLKLRTMVTDAETLLVSLASDAGNTSLLFKMRDDPRITGPGRSLRRFSLDELPQLVNVLRGEMSLVGPRPPLAAEVAQYVGHTSRRLHVRPGITGLWQVSGRSDLTWEEAVRLDLYYVDNWSMLQDLHILLQTVGAVMGSRGAY